MIPRQHCKKALVTGSSRGIGRAVALRLAQDGFEILVHCAGNIGKAESLVREIEEKGGKASYIAADLCDIRETRKLCEFAKDVDVLVLNASIQYRKPWEQITPEEAYDQLNCNYLSSLLLAQAAVPHMREKGWGRVIAIGSVQEAKPHPDMLVYSSSKAAQTNMVRSLALQLAKDGITVNSVAPGVIMTDRNRDSLADPAYIEKVKASIPLGYFGEPEDLAGIVSLLCSEEGRYITGQSLYVDGGKGIQ